MPSILGCNFSNLSLKETIDKIVTSIKNNQKIIYMDINADKIVYAHYNPYMMEIINNSDIVNPDGMSVYWASHFLGMPLKERIAGIDLFQKLIEISSQYEFKIFFLGAKKDVLELMIQNIKNKYGEKIIAGYNDGYFDENSENDIVEKINSTKTQLLFIGITSPKKEQFIERNKNKLNVNFIMGVGGSFDVVAGKVKRAPKFIQKLGFEWLYRIYQEPKRLWKRYAKTNPIFIYLVLKEKLTNMLKYLIIFFVIF